ncbi:MAG: hypothetical protein WC444_06360 [Candidatus Paceibacterota bacterium]
MKRSDIRRLYVHNRMILMKGFNEVGIVISIWNTSMLLLLTLSNLFGRSIKVVWMVVIAIPTIVVVFYLVGLLLYKRGFMNAESEWIASVSPPHMDIIKRLDHIEKELQDVKTNIRTHS